MMSNSSFLTELFDPDLWPPAWFDYSHKTLINEHLGLKMNFARFYIDNKLICKCFFLQDTKTKFDRE